MGGARDAPQNRIKQLSSEGNQQSRDINSSLLEGAKIAVLLSCFFDSKELAQVMATTLELAQRGGRFPNSLLGNAKTVGDGVGYQGFGSTLLIGALIRLADAKIVVLSSFLASLF
jgi:hypothetical protein